MPKGLKLPNSPNDLFDIELIHKTAWSIEGLLFKLPVPKKINSEKANSQNA